MESKLKNFIVPSENTYAIHMDKNRYAWSERVACFVQNSDNYSCEGYVSTTKRFWLKEPKSPDIYATNGSFDVIENEHNKHAFGTGCFYSIDQFIRTLCGVRIGYNFSRIEEFFKRYEDFQGENALSSDDGFDYSSVVWLTDKILFDKLEEFTGIIYDRKLWKSAYLYFREYERAELKKFMSNQNKD